MAKVFPEEMDRIDPANVPQSLRTVEDYIRYITERVEFAVGRTTRMASEGGISDLAVVALLNEMNGTLKSLESAVTNLRNDVSALDERVEALE